MLCPVNEFIERLYIHSFEEKNHVFFITDAFKNVPNPCANNPDSQVYFPHPTDVSKFIQCDRYGRMYIIQVHKLGA